MLRLALLTVLGGCALDAESGLTAGHDGPCSGAPAISTRDWRHPTSSVVALGDPHHRGVDLIASTRDERQVIAGKIAYGNLDKDLEDEDVSVFACVASTWQPVGTATTDGEGRFSLALTGETRLAAGLHQLYVAVDGDGTGAEFVSLVADDDAPVLVADIDGTLTASENAYPTSLVTNAETAAQPGAASALARTVGRGVQVVYVSARGDRFTQDTRDWLATHGFPRGALRLPQAIVTLPGEDTVELKSSILASLSAFDIVAGFGNRASDVAAYTSAGLPAARILIKLPEFSDELASDLAARKATGFDDYGTLDMAALTSF